MLTPLVQEVLVQQMSKLLALDQASNTTGWAIFDDNKLMAYGHFVTTQTDLGEKLYEIRNFVQEWVKKYDIDEVIFEDVQLQDNVGNNVKTFKILAEVFGVIDEVLTELSVPHSAVLAPVWKAKVGIKGRYRAEQKKNAQQYVNNLYSISATSDEADAICIGIYKTQLNAPQHLDHDWSD